MLPLWKIARMMFRDMLRTAQTRNRSTLAVGLAPRLAELPLPLTRYDEPYLPFGKAVIDATADLVCAYAFHLAAYLALGAAGAIALERTLAYVPKGIVKILHGPFVGLDYAIAAFEGALNADAVTLALAGAADSLESVRPYLAQPAHGVFLDVLPGDGARFVLRLNVEYPGQVGTLKSVAAGHNVLGLSFDPYQEIDWHWGPRLMPSRGDDYCEALRQAATSLRREPGQ